MSEKPFADDHDARAHSDEQILLEAQSVIAGAYELILSEQQERELAKIKRDQPLAQSVPFDSPSRIRLMISEIHDWMNERIGYFKRS